MTTLFVTIPIGIVASSVIECSFEYGERCIFENEANHQLNWEFINVSKDHFTLSESKVVYIKFQNPFLSHC